MEDIYPYIATRGIKIHDWDKWEDPFRLTMDAYWRYQGEKERKLYSVLDAFAQNNGHLGVTDARYLNAIKLFISGISPLEYVAHRGFSPTPGAVPRPRPARRLPDAVGRRDAPRPDPDARHRTTTSTSTACATSTTAHDRVWFLSVPKASSTTPSPPARSSSWSDRLLVQYVLTNLLFVPFTCRGAAYNGDMGTMTFGFSAQSDEARHMTLGLDSIKFILRAGPGQRAHRAALDRQVDLARLPRADPRRDDDGLHAAQAHRAGRKPGRFRFEQNGGALFRTSRYGIQDARLRRQIALDKGITSATRRGHLLHQCAATTFHLDAGRGRWLAVGEIARTPSTSTTVRATSSGASRPTKTASNKTLPMLCQTCQIPLVFTEPGDPTKICYRESRLQGREVPLLF